MKPPTFIEYRSHRIRPGYLFLAIVVIAIGLGVLGGGLHATRLTCVRGTEAESGSCRIRRYALFRAIDDRISIDDIASFDVRVRTGSKGSQYAEVTIRTTRESGRPDLELETGGWGHVDPARAQAVRSQFMMFEQSGTPFEAWLTLGPFTNVILTLFGIAFLAGGAALLREQLGQLRTIRIVVDHARQVVVVRGKELPWNEIDDAMVEQGRALFWSSGKNEYVLGYRVVVVRKSGVAVPVTKDFRAGDEKVHERARETLLRALGRSSKG